MAAATSGIEKYALPALGVVLVVIAFILFSKGGSVTQGTGVIAPDTSAEVAAINAQGQVAQTNAASALAYDQVIGQEFGQLASLSSNVTEYNDAAKVQDMQYGIALQQSQIAAGVATTQLQDQAAAQQQAQNNSFWSNIIGDAFGSATALGKLFSPSPSSGGLFGTQGGGVDTVPGMGGYVSNP